MLRALGNSGHSGGFSPVTLAKQNSGSSPGAPGRPRRRGFGWAVYLVVFAAFVLLNVLAPQTMAATTLYVGNDRTISLAGVNVAVIFGLGLIAAAIALALGDLAQNPDLPG